MGTSRGFFWSTMVSRSLLVTLVAVLAVIVASNAEEVRHLRFNESYTEYVPVGPRLDALITNPNVHFMDITSGDPVASAALNPRAAGYVYPPQAEHNVACARCRRRRDGEHDDHGGLSCGCPERNQAVQHPPVPLL